MRPAARFLLRRLAGRLALIAAAASCAYLLCAAVLDPRGGYAAQQPPPPQSQVDALLVERNLHPDTPLADRYLVWAGGVLSGDLGTASDGRPVGEALGEGAGASLRLVSGGAVLGILAGVGAGAWAAARPGSRGPAAASAAAMVLISVPPVVIAAVLQAGALLLNGAAGMQILPAAGEADAGAPPGEQLRYAVLPALVLALPLAAVLGRYQESVMRAEMSAEYVRTARAKGLRLRRAVAVHVLRSSVIPAVTYASYCAAGLFTGAVFAEQVFGRHGVGSMLISAIEAGDANSAAAVCLFAAVCVAGAGAAADAARVALDPRVRA